MKYKTLKQYLKEHSLETRKAETKSVLKKYPDRAPVMVFKSEHTDTVQDIDKNKYLVPRDLTFGNFAFVIRKRIKVNPENAIYIFVNQTLAQSSERVGDVYDRCKSEDGFLYCVYSGEATFGL